jgi:hypothetical protein
MKRGDLIAIVETSRDAMQAVQDNWEKGDLAGAVRGLSEAIEECNAALKWWESDE